MNYTLITGASKGIGKAIAIEAANRGMNLLLVARSADLLDKLAKELSSKNVSVKTLALDLCERDSHKKVFQYVKDNGLNVNMLVNNAGMGYYGYFEDGDLQKQLDVMNLNMDACVKLAYEFLHATDSSQRRYIINTSSTGAYTPVPRMAIYTATKSFMLFFSRALREELKRKNVYVTALCPGGTETEFFGPAKMEKVIEKNAAFMMAPEGVAKVGLDAVMKNKSVAIPGITNRLGAAVSKVMPHDLVVSVSGKIFTT
jgi:short-subunit dehydrogenase